MYPGSEYRFIDRDVREDPDLARLAFEFAYNYGGDFDFLVHAHTYAREHGCLHTSMARGVLNCMRTDNQGLQLLQQRRQQPKLYVVERRRPVYIVLPSEWHYDYIMSLNKSARVVHILDRQKSHIRWYTHIGNFKFELYTLCKPFYAKEYQFAHGVPEGRRPCPQCWTKAGLA